MKLIYDERGIVTGRVARRGRARRDRAAFLAGTSKRWNAAKDDHERAVIVGQSAMAKLRKL